MSVVPSSPAANALMQEILGYLNFSSGTSDPKFLQNLNALFREVLVASPQAASPAAVLEGWLDRRLTLLQQSEPAFADSKQAGFVLRCVFGHLIEAYRHHHRDLLFNQSRRDTEQPLLLGRMIEAVLGAGPPWDDPAATAEAAIAQLNDYVGYRPVAVLESRQRIEPYRHEWVRPVPLYIEGVGVAVGRYEGLVRETLDILRRADPQLLAQAYFDPDALEELALDPRAYDFDHPANKRPNYHFGQWDPHRIDNRGRYRRFIVHQVTLDAMLSRVDSAVDSDPETLQFEAAAVLAGTMLMASGISGSGPETHDSTVSLATLLMHIAAYRDEFYRQLLSRVEGPLADHLRAEVARLKQPLGGARQHLNQELARRRAQQMEHVHLAQLFARMGYPEEALREARTVQVASARMLCEIYCRLTRGHRAIDEQNLAEAAAALPEIEDLVFRGIECGALVDPWNVVGFGGNFSLFPALENSIYDYRIDTLIELVEQTFALASRTWSEAAAKDDEPLERQCADFFARMAAWWDQYATSTVSDVKRLVGKEQEISTNLVAGALCAWHKAGAAAGDIKFWSMFVDQFDSAKAFQLVVEALLEKGDYVASMALLMQWLSQGERIPLEDGDSSFHRLALQWLADVEHSVPDCAPPGEDQQAALDERWPLVERFFAYLEPNADQFWRIPGLELTGAGGPSQELLRQVFGVESEDPDEDESGEDDDDEEDFLYSAAYENVSYRDTTDDGLDGSLMESGESVDDFELEDEARRLAQRLTFQTTLARMWSFVARVWGTGHHVADERREVFRSWQEQAAENHRQLLRLVEEVYGYQLPAPSGSHDSLVEYDRRRIIKEGIIDRIVSTAVETADADRILRATGPNGNTAQVDPATDLMRAVLVGDAACITRTWPAFTAALRSRPILYIPLSRGGHPRQIVEARVTQQTLHELLAWLPRLGRIRETCELLEIAHQMEEDHTVGPGAVTEFDRLFETGQKALVESIVASAECWNGPLPPGEREETSGDGDLVECLHLLTESQLRRWLQHSRTLRLSVVEQLADEQAWKAFVQFVKDYGDDLFTQRFLNLGNIRAILHQGVEAWLARLHEDPQEHEDLRLLDDLGVKLSATDAAKQLGIALEAIVENYTEYRDYNSTTTQSDCGSQIFTLIDFLRLRAEYDRVAWNLKPVVMAHEIVVQHGRVAAAEIWRRALADRTAQEADRLGRRLCQLSEKYGMRLPTIADRIAERFIRPLAIDRVRALVPRAMQETGQPEAAAFAALQQEIQDLASEPTGAGFDIPAWLAELEDEVTRVRQCQRQGTSPNDLSSSVPRVFLSHEDLHRQLVDSDVEK